MPKRSPNGHPKVERDKKKKALNSEEYKRQIEELAKRGVTLEDVQAIYDRCQETKQTKITRDTLVSKLLELLEYFETRNVDIKDDEFGFISKVDVLQMILKNPRIITSDIKNNIVVKCNVITDKKGGKWDRANESIKSNPGIFRKTVKAIMEGK